MPFKPLNEEKKEPCLCPEHNPPSHYNYTQDCIWVCPQCGEEFVIRVPKVMY